MRECVRRSLDAAAGDVHRGNGLDGQRTALAFLSPVAHDPEVLQAGHVALRTAVEALRDDCEVGVAGWAEGRPMTVERPGKPASWHGGVLAVGRAIS